MNLALYLLAALLFLAARHCFRLALVLWLERPRRTFRPSIRVVTRAEPVIGSAFLVRPERARTLARFSF